MFWDLRIEKLLKKGNKRLDDSELVWRPMHVVHLLSMAGAFAFAIHACAHARAGCSCIAQCRISQT